MASNADVVHTYDRLLGREPKARRMRKRLAGMSYSMSLFLIYFGTRRQYPNLQHHNIIFGPRYRELLKDIFGRGQLADDFSLYLRVRRHDPILRWRHRIAKPSMCYPRCLIWVSCRWIGAWKGRVMPSASWIILNCIIFQTCATRLSRSGFSHQRIFNRS